MVTSKATLEKIREIINKHYNRLIVSVLGSKALNLEQLKQLQQLGYDVTNSNSLMEIIYNHNFINPVGKPGAPTSLPDMQAQQKVTGIKPVGEAHDYTITSIEDATKQYIEKLKMDVSTRIEGIIRQNNDQYKLNALQNIDRSFEADQLVKESSLGKVRQMLRDTAKEGNRDWQRVAVTEMGNAIGVASVDRIVGENKDKNLNEVFVYRIPVNDSKTCKYCRRFYNEEDSYKLYRLSTLLGNGTNYGRKTDQWLPVIGSTHPNSRTSQIIELPPGWIIGSGGKLKYIGLDKWSNYIHEKLHS